MKQSRLFNRAIHRICQTASDPALPYSERFYQLAGAAVGFGLQLADAPSMVETLLSQSDGDPELREEQERLYLLVDEIADEAMQESFYYVAQRTGTPLLALIAGWVLYHFQATHRGPKPSNTDYARAAADFCLRFTLLLAQVHPDLARGYRSLIPSRGPEC